MELSAEKTLRMCSIAHEMLEEETVADRWAVVWTGAMVLLRSVGDVLNNVDGKDPKGRQNKLGKVQEKFFRTLWQDEPIFKDFIKAERDLLAHEASSTVTEEETVHLLVSQAVVNNTEEKNEIFDLPSDLFRPIIVGPFAGEDARDIYETAVVWWRDQLQAVKAELI